MNEERKGFTAKDILIQLLFVILFVFIMIWLFPTKSNVTNLSSKLDALTSSIYMTNLNTMKDAAIRYYTTDRLPQKLNDTDRMTLKEMQDKKLVIEFVDGNGNTCNANSSYVEVIKLENEYQMKVNLSCTDKDAYIIVHLGCYDYCKATGVCEKEETPVVVENIPPVVVKKCTYEYLKVTNGKWGDYGNWSAWTTSKVSETDYRKVELKTEKVNKGTQLVTIGYKEQSVPATTKTTKYCPAGYKVNSDNKCEAYGYYTAKCPVGYTLNSNGTCSGTETETTKSNPVCPDGYTRSGAKCYKSVGTSSTKTPTCADSTYTFNGTTCVGPTTKQTCTKGEYVTTLSGSSVPANTSSYIYEGVSSDYVYKCHDACAFEWVFTYKKYKAVCTGGETKTATPVCPDEGYTLNGNVCVKYTTGTTSVDATCKSGTLEGEYCYSRRTVGNTVDAACPAGFKLQEGTNKCYGVNVVDKISSVSYSCSDNSWTLNDSTHVCTRTVPVTEERTVYEDVKYYRYKERSYISGTRKTEWSSSENDTYLIGQGFSLTGNKKCS